MAENNKNRSGYRKRKDISKPEGQQDVTSNITLLQQHAFSKGVLGERQYVFSATSFSEQEQHESSMMAYNELQQHVAGATFYTESQRQATNIELQQHNSAQDSAAYSGLQWTSPDFNPNTEHMTGMAFCTESEQHIQRTIEATSLEQVPRVTSIGDLQPNMQSKTSDIVRQRLIPCAMNSNFVNTTLSTGVFEISELREIGQETSATNIIDLVEKANSSTSSLRPHFTASLKTRESLELDSKAYRVCINNGKSALEEASNSSSELEASLTSNTDDPPPREAVHLCGTSTTYIENILEEASTSTCGRRNVLTENCEIQELEEIGRGIYTAGATTPGSTPYTEQKRHSSGKTFCSESSQQLIQRTMETASLEQVPRMTSIGGLQLDVHSKTANNVRQRQIPCLTNSSSVNMILSTGAYDISESPEINRETRTTNRTYLLEKANSSTSTPFTATLDTQESLKLDSKAYRMCVKNGKVVLEKVSNPSSEFKALLISNNKDPRSREPYQLCGTRTTNREHFLEEASTSTCGLRDVLTENREILESEEIGIYTAGAANSGYLPEYEGSLTSSVVASVGAKYGNPEWKYFDTKMFETMHLFIADLTLYTVRQSNPDYRSWKVTENMRIVYPTLWSEGISHAVSTRCQNAQFFIDIAVRELISSIKTANTSDGVRLTNIFLSHVHLLATTMLCKSDNKLKRSVQLLKLFGFVTNMMVICLDIPIFLIHSGFLCSAYLICPLMKWMSITDVYEFAAWAKRT